MSFDPLRGPMKRSRNFYITVVSILMLILLGIGQNILNKRSIAQGKSVVMAPRFEVDPHWPKPLPNHWYIGMTIGVACDAQDHVWIVHRPDTGSANAAASDQNTASRRPVAPP